MIPWSRSIQICRGKAWLVTYGTVTGGDHSCNLLPSREAVACAQAIDCIKHSFNVLLLAHVQSCMCWRFSCAWNWLYWLGWCTSEHIHVYLNSCTLEENLITSQCYWWPIVYWARAVSLYLTANSYSLKASSADLYSYKSWRCTYWSSDVKESFGKICRSWTCAYRHSTRL